MTDGDEFFEPAAHHQAVGGDVAEIARGEPFFAIDGFLS